MKKNTKIFGIIGLLVVLVGAAGLATAFHGNPGEQTPNFDSEIHEQVQNAIESGDYETWIQAREENSLPTHGRIFSVVSEENFSLFSEMHSAMQSEEYENAQEIREELGLESGKMHKKRMQEKTNHCNKSNEFRERHGNCPFAG